MRSDSSRLTLELFESSISRGDKSVKFLFREFFIDKALDRTHIVIKSIRHIIVVENTVVLILLENCLSVKLFRPL